MNSVSLRTQYGWTTKLRWKLSIYLWPFLGKGIDIKIKDIVGSRTGKRPTERSDTAGFSELPSRP